MVRDQGAFAARRRGWRAVPGPGTRGFRLQPEGQRAEFSTAGSKDYALIDEFLAEHGHTLQSVDKLSPGDRRELLRRASSYATLRLAEIESRAHFVDDLER